jgi:hypothetical protein
MGAFMDLDSLRVGRERLLRVFQYLEALNQHRNPPRGQIREQLWTLWLRDLPDHPSIQQRRPRTPEENPAEKSDLSATREEVDFILKVARPKLTRAPEPPDEIKSWLQNGWDDPSKELAYRESKNESGVKSESVVVRFEDDLRIGSPGAKSGPETRGQHALQGRFSRNCTNSTVGQNVRASASS